MYRGMWRGLGQAAGDGHYLTGPQEQNVGGTGCGKHAVSFYGPPSLTMSTWNQNQMCGRVGADFATPLASPQFWLCCCLGGQSQD